MKRFLYLLILFLPLLTGCNLAERIPPQQVAQPVTQPNPQIISMSMINDKAVWLVVKQGQIEKDKVREGDSDWGKYRAVLRTTDGGKTWANVTPKTISTCPFYYSETAIESCFLDSNTGWIAATDLQNQSKQINIFSTADGGATWKASAIDTTYLPSIHSLSFVDKLHGWVNVMPGDQPHTAPQGYLYSTSDGGETWSKSQLPRGGSTDFVSPSCGIFNNGNSICQTIDGGKS